MKKIIMTTMVLFSISLYSESYYPLYPNLTIERGYSGVSIKTFYKNKNYNSIDNINIIKNIDEVILNNLEINENIKDSAFESEQSSELTLGKSINKDFTFQNLSLNLKLTSNDEELYGLSVNYNKIKNKITTIKNNGYQINLFYSNRFENEKSTNFTSTIYVGSIDEFKDNQYFGIRLYYSSLEEDFNEFFSGFDTKIRGQKLEEGIKKYQNIDFEINKLVRKNIYFQKFDKLSFDFSLGYYHEFLPNKKYEVKDRFENTIQSNLSITYNYKETTNFNIGYKIKKSLNYKSYENEIYGQFIYTF